MSGIAFTFRLALLCSVGADQIRSLSELLSRRQHCRRFSAPKRRTRAEIARERGPRPRHALSGRNEDILSLDIEVDAENTSAVKPVEQMITQHYGIALLGGAADAFLLDVARFGRDDATSRDNRFE